MKKLQLLSCFFLVVLLSCNQANETKNAEPQKQPVELSTIQLQNIDGETVEMKQYNGKVLFVNFWATWCKPCLEEMPSIAEVINRMKEKNIEFLFASDESIDQITDFKSAHDYPFNYVQTKNMAELNIMALPTTYVFDKSGNLVFNKMGTRNWADKENIDLLLNLIK